MKKTIHISVESIYYWICWGIILLPPSISHLSSLLDKVITCLGFFLILLLVLIKNIQIVKSKALLFLVLFVFWCIGVTFIQSPGKLSIAAVHRCTADYRDLSFTSAFQSSKRKPKL